MNAKLFINGKNRLLAVVFLMLSFVCTAQNPGDVVQNFGGAPSTVQGFNSVVNTIVELADGKKIIGGSFTSYNGIVENRIIRLNSDGTKDASFNTGSGFDQDVYSIVIQPDGKIIVAGLFSTYKGLTEKGIIRLYSDGTKDASFNSGSGFNDFVSTVTLQSDGKIIVGGAFDSYNGVQESYFMRLNSNGTKDASFDTGFNNVVSIITIQPDGKILVGGLFTTYKGVTEKKLIRLNPNGDKDTSFITGTGFDYSVGTIVLQPDGKIIVGGYFASYNGLNEGAIIRLNDNGTKDTSFSTGAGFDFGVYAIALQPDGKIIVGGEYALYNGLTENSIIRLNSDGTKDTSFGTGTGFNSYVNAICLQPDGKIIIGGNFTSYKELPSNRVISLNTDGSKDSYFGVGGFSHSVRALAIQTDGKMIVAGEFISYRGATEGRIIRLNPDATKDSSFDIGTGLNDYVRVLALQPDGKIIVGGYFTTYKGVTANRIIRLNPDGTEDTSFNTETGFNNSVVKIALQPNGKILVGGSFTTYKGLPQNYIIRLNPDGTKDGTFNVGSGFDSHVEAIAIQSDGKIILGGQFASYNGITANSIIRLNPDGSNDVSFATGTGFNELIISLTLQPDGKIIIGGIFSSYQGIAEKGLIRLNEDGTKDTTFNLGTGLNYNDVYTTTLQPNGKIIIGGYFTAFNGVSQNHILRLNPDGTKDGTFNIGTGFDYSVNTTAIHSDGKILVGGGFTSYNNSNSSAYLITLYGDVPLSNEDFIEKNTIFLWPNPVQNSLNINNLDGMVESVKIYNLQGKLVYENANFAESIDVSSFASGMYVVRLKTENGNVVKKFIKS